MILETDRLYLREMNQEDFHSLCEILQDEETMYAYEGAFDDAEVQEWLDRQLSRYRKWNFGLWAVILKESGKMIGQCGLTMQPWKETEVLEIGYLLNRRYWHKGYAVEAAKACKKYAFEVLKADEVCSIIRDTNTASCNVAVRNGMTIVDTWTKHYRGIDMPHVRYVVQRDNAYPVSIAFHDKYAALYDKPVVVSLKDGRKVAGIFADEFYEDEVIMISLFRGDPAFLKISEIEKMEIDNRRKPDGEWLCGHDAPV